MRRLPPLLCRVPAWVFWMMFVVQSGSNEDDVWNADSGASCHRKHDRARIYNVRLLHPVAKQSRSGTVGELE